MANQIDFFCTRCRRFLHYPDKTAGAVINCPYCQQALIVPTIDPVEWSESDSNYIPIPGNYENRSFSVENTNLPYRSDEFRDETDLLSPVRSAPIADSEFLSRVAEVPLEKKPVPPPLPNGETVVDQELNSYSPPILAPLTFSEAPNDQPGRKHIFLPILMILFVALIAGSVIFFLQDREMRSSDEIGSTPGKKIPIEGELIYMDANNKPQKDEGSLIFLFPEDFPQDKPLAITGLAPNRPKPVEFREFKQKLTDLGGYYLETDSNGIFDLFVLRKGRYRVLLVSAHVFQKPGTDRQKEFAEIGKYLYHPDQLLLLDHQFLWTIWDINEKNGSFGHNFGRSDGRILP